ncbi:MAG: hypothetical protein WDM85_18840 [Caulobacteraceae bacterium]
MTFAIQLLAVAGLTAVSTLSAADTPPPPGDGVAQAVAAIADARMVGTPPGLGRILQIPDLETKLTWTALVGDERNPSFHARYKPTNSPLGIIELSLHYDTRLSLIGDRRAKMLVRLVLDFEKDKCPIQAELAAALHTRASVFPMPGYDGGPGYVLTTFNVPQPRSQPVRVSFVGANTCELTISQDREIV